MNRLEYLVICLFFLFLCPSCKKECDYIHNYYPFIYSGIIEYEKGDLNKAYDLLDQAFNICSPTNTVTIYEINIMAIVSAKLGKHQTCYRMIEEQLKNGFTLSKYTDDPIFSDFFSSELGKELIGKSDMLIQEYTTNSDSQVHAMLLEMLQDDQKARGTEEQNTFDSINEEKLIWIIEEGRFPQESLSRYNTKERIDIHTVLLHTDDSIRVNYFLPKIKKLIQKGKCPPYIYASLYDQYYLYNELPQIYGTYKKRDRSLSEHIGIEEINKNRISIGLQSLEDEHTLHQLKIKNYPDTYGKFYQ